MSETPSTAPPPPPAAAPPAARLRRPRFSFVWLIPLIAAAIAGYLGYRTILEQGPLVTLTFDSADGLAAGQTLVKFKAVALGTVDSIDLSPDNRNVIVKLRMNNVGARFLTSRARFWVVRPNVTGGNISGLDTLVSGAYIAVDPGLPGGHYQDRFEGLETPPGVRSDEPGQTYVLQADNIGSLNTGAPVFYRDVVVGEVLGYDIGNGLGPISVNIFIRAPFDNLVRPESHFWNSSGITAEIKNGALHLELQSLQALVSGGVTFNFPPEAAHSAPSAKDSLFHLYANEDDAETAGFQKQIPIVAYFNSSVGGLTRGAAVNVLGIQVGEVTDVKLLIDPEQASARIRVAMNLQPERIFQSDLLPPNMTMQQGLQQLVNKGLRAELDTANYLTNQKVVSLTVVPNAAPASVGVEGDAIVLPSKSGSLDNIAASLATISTKLSQVPFDKIGDNINRLLVTVNGTVGGKQLKQSLTQLNATLKTADTTLGQLSDAYGGDSDFQRNLEQLMDQANSTLRSIDLLTSYLDRHPESLLLGRHGP